MPETLKEGKLTSEYQEARKGGAWGIVALVLGGLISVGSALLPTLDGSGPTGIIMGAVVAIAGVIQQTLTQLGYTKSRTDVKVADALRENKGTRATTT